jgi:type I restriction enzyme S subunit
MKGTWARLPFEDCVEKVTYTRKVQRKDFLAEGEYPIVSQEEEFINGYWNQKADLFSVGRPIIVFGDHTKVLKYVDFDFVLGADGVKVLQAREFLFPRFFYYQLQTADLESLGYARHYRLLKELEIGYPSLAEQRRIVGILDEAFEGIATAKANAEKNLQNARALFECHLESVFTERGEGWVEKRLDELCTFSSGGTPSKSNSSYWRGKIPWVSGRDMKSTRLSDSALHISQGAVDESATRMASPGTLLILVRGMGLAHGAQIAELLVACAFNQDIRGIHSKPGLMPRYLLFALRDGINSSETVMSNAAHGTLKIDSDELQKVMIPFPPLEQQRRIVAVIDGLSEETDRLASIYQRKLVALDELKKSLLHQAFSGEL